MNESPGKRLELIQAVHFWFRLNRVKGALFLLIYRSRELTDNGGFGLFALRVVPVSNTCLITGKLSMWVTIRLVNKLPLVPCASYLS